MKATELRLGNLFANIEDNSIYKATKINEDTIEGLCINNMGWFGEQHFHLIEQVLPIKITEEWLLKFGFERRITEIKPNIFTLKIKLIGSSASEIKLEGWKGNIFLICDGNYASDALKYVHQLQNLYFALTGEELTQVSEGKK